MRYEGAASEHWNCDSLLIFMHGNLYHFQRYTTMVLGFIIIIINFCSLQTTNLVLYVYFWKYMYTLISSNSENLLKLRIYCRIFFLANCILRMFRSLISNYWLSQVSKQTYKWRSKFTIDECYFLFSHILFTLHHRFATIILSTN